MSTSGFHEPLVHCDVEELKVPEYLDDLIALKGASAAQATFASNMRTKKMAEWKPDLPVHIFNALKGIADATWWLANQSADSSNIGWPKSWASVSRNPSQPELGQPASSAKQSRERLMNAPGGQPGDARNVPSNDIEQFDAFARKACQSPELAYLTMMAFLYRQTKDPKVLAKFTEARRKIDGHLDAIDNILGSPGA